MLNRLAPAVAATLCALAPAASAPALAAPFTGLDAAPAARAAAPSPGLTLVDDRDARRHDRRRWVPGRHYDEAPHGWRRYERRPTGWRSRGCIVVGPLWFCP